MQFKNAKLKEAETRLLDELVPYLISKGIKFNTGSTKFRCINPAHNDSNPSASIVPLSHGTVFHCFGCQISGTIFQAAHLLDNMPITGPGWIDTLKVLSQQMGLPVPEVELTKEEQELIDIYRAYEDAAYLISTSTIDRTVPKFDERGWDNQIGYKYGIGFVNSYLEFISNLGKLGHTPELLERAGIARKIDPKNPSYIAPTMFDRDNTIFTLYDYQGTPVAFAARNANYTSTSHVSKYINSANSPIYRKKELLYGLHHSRVSAVKQGLILVEGYADWITMFEAGIRNVAALGGTALTREHLNLLMNLGITKIFLCLDNDNGGQIALKRILDDVISELPQFEVSIIELPEGKDPDDVLHGLDEQAAHKLWSSLPVHSAFQWRLKKFDSGTSMEEIATKMIPLIVSDPNIILREKMAKDLAEYTGIRIQAIISQMDRMTKIEDFKDSERLKSITNALIRDVQRNPRNVKDIIASYETILAEQEKTVSTDNLGVSETSKAFGQMIETWKNRKDTIVGIRTGYRELDEALNGLQEARAVGIGGKANHGKSAFVSNIAYNVLKLNEDCIVIMHTTDDSRETFLSRLIAIDQNLIINSVTNPKDKFKIFKDGKAFIDENKKQLWYNGVKNIQSMVEGGRLIVKDSTHGTSLGYTESLIKYYKYNNPNKRILVIFDNFHKATDFAEMEERIRYKRMSGHIKLLSEKYNVAFVATMEYTKIEEGTQPSNTRLAESSQMEYDLSVILHVYNQLKDIGTDRTKLVIDPKAEVPIPVVEIKVGKNKQGSFADSLFYKFTTEMGKFEEMPRKLVRDQFFTNKQPSQFGAMARKTS